MHVGRNDPCYCGSGKKYKSCCLTKDANPMIEVEKNMKDILSEYENDDRISMVLLSLLEIMHREQWQGACHALSAMIYVLFCEIDLSPKLFVGEVKVGVDMFDHSWIELDEKIIDLAISRGMNGINLAGPVVMNIDLTTKKPVGLEYGTHSGRGLGTIAMQVQKMDVVTYLDNFPGNANGLWRFVLDVAELSNISADLEILRAKYKNAYWAYNTWSAAARKDEYNV